MGFRQKETEFEYSSSMIFNPKKNQSEAGLSIFSQDDNYINFTVQKTKNKTLLNLLWLIPVLIAKPFPDVLIVLCDMKSKL